MKIVQIEDFFHPDAGYQINILSKFMSKKGHDVTIITSRIDNVPDGLTSFFGRDKLDEKDLNYSNEYGVKIIRVPTIRFVSGRAVFKNDIFEVVNNLDPDILYLHGNDTLIAMQYLLKLKKLKYPILLDSHMLEMASVNKFNKIYRFVYRKILTPRIIKNNIPVIRTQNDPYVEKHLGIPLSRAPWISVGSDTVLFHPDVNKRDKFRQRHGITEDDFVVIYTGKLDESKGADLLADAFIEKFQTNRNVVLVVVGNSSGQYGKGIEEVFERSSNRIIRFPTQKYIDLPNYYQAADIAIFPKQSSLSFYDAQACGLPVVSEYNNVNVDRLSYKNGFNFTKGSIQDIRRIIMMCAEMPAVEFEHLKKNSIEFIKMNYDYSKITDQYLHIINKILESRKTERG